LEGKQTTMASDSDMLNIGSIRLKKDYPVAGVQPARSLDPVLHPDAAAMARKRIDALPDASTLLQTNVIPAAPTADLITDKATLAAQIAPASSVVKRRKLPSALSPILTAIGIFLIVLLLFKLPIILSQLGYSFGSKPPAAATAPAATEVVPAENTITIAKINVHAPVIYEPSISEAAIQKALQSGVVHYGNTAAPGQIGNVAIFGHSSNDWWEPGDFKFVFVLLDKLAPGDQITMDYQSQRYTYEVTSSTVVEPTNVAVLNKTAEPTLTLITCTPPGTSLRRLVVTAKQVSPNPSQATKVTPTPAATANADGSLPSSAPTFLTQVTEAWNGVVNGFKSLFGGGSTGAPATSGQPSPDQLPAIK
jgi:LPXTG-site transpeptidase (sortase) family protein